MCEDPNMTTALFDASQKQCAARTSVLRYHCWCNQGEHANLRTYTRLQSATPALLQNGLYHNLAVARVDVG